MGLDRRLVARQPCRQITGHAIVRSRVDTVRGKVYLQHIIILNLEILSGRTTHKSLRFSRKNYDSVVRIAHADFVLGTYHTERLDTANLRFLDFKRRPVRTIKSCAYRGNNHSLPGSHIGRAAYNLHRTFAKLHRGDMKMVAVGVLGASKNLAYDNAGKSSTDRFNGFHASRFKTYRGKSGRELFGGKLEVHIVLEPFI